MRVSSSLQDDLDMMNLLSARWSRRLGYFSGLAAMVGLILATARPVTAQSYQERPQPRERNFQQRQMEPRSSPSGAPSNLPDWAEPSQPQEGQVSGGEVSPNAAVPPPPPDNPSRIPVDGGLALLAAAGAGYAVRKLNEDNEDEDPVA